MTHVIQYGIFIFMICYLSIIEWTEKIGKFSIKIGKCPDSRYCGLGNFCNYDFGSTGYCESCGQMESCEGLGLITERGENECRAVCEGEAFIATSVFLPITLKKTGSCIW